MNPYDTSVKGPEGRPQDDVVRIEPPNIVAMGTAGAPAPGRLTTTFRLTGGSGTGGTFIDTGAIAHGFPPERREDVRTVLLSHAHLDHTLGLPFLLGRFPLAVHGTSSVLAAVRESLLDGRIWPDLHEFATWHEFAHGDTIDADPWSVQCGPASHTVPCTSFMCRTDGISRDDGGAVAIVGDTRSSDEVLRWVADARPQACVVECSFPDDYAEGAQRWGHQTPRDLPTWREALGDECRLLVTHIKPVHESAVRAECEALNDPGLSILQDGDVIWPL
jgi:ribonuclease BN (tRNA processing enzyme)